jgi:hypothetical protein
MAFLDDKDINGWASPTELDAILRKSARCQARLETQTNPVVYIMIGATLGMVYFSLRNRMVSTQVAQAVENLLI